MEWLRWFWYGFLAVVGAMGVYILASAVYCIYVAVYVRAWRDMLAYMLHAVTAVIWLVAAVVLARYAFRLMEYLPW